MSEVRFTPHFKRRLKTLTKRDRQIQIDIQPIIDSARGWIILSVIKSLG
ncbi:MAG: hypothetical protein V7K68_16575 [Nostoc sp.]